MTRLQGPLTLALGLTAPLVLASCGQTGSTAATPTTAPNAHGNAAAGHETSPAPSAPSVSPSAAAGRQIDITVKGKQVTPAPGTVNIGVGESLTVAVTSDHADQLHAHGFEIEKDIKAGQPLVFTVKGAKTGVFEVELHDPALRILTVAVR